jgi:hypothetical protein
MMVNAPFARLTAFRVVPFTATCAADIGSLDSASWTVPVTVRVGPCPKAAAVPTNERANARRNTLHDRCASLCMGYLQQLDSERG